MKTSVMEVRDMLSVLSVVAVETRIGEVPGVESVTVNYAAGNATVRYDETRLDVADIKSAVRQSGHDSVATAASDGRESRTAAGAPPATAASSALKASPIAPASPGPTTDASAPTSESPRAAWNASTSGGHDQEPAPPDRK